MMRNNTKKWINKMQEKVNDLSKEKSSSKFSHLDQVYPEHVMIYDSAKNTIIKKKNKDKEVKNLLALTGDENFEDKISKIILIVFIIFFVIIILVGLLT